MSERTKGKWKTDKWDIVDENGLIIADCDVDEESYSTVPYEDKFANAEFICKAVNLHDDLVESLEEIKDFIESEEWQVWSADRENVGSDSFDTEKSMELFGAKLEKAKELLAKVKGESE